MFSKRASRREIVAYGLPNTVAALPIIPIAVLLPSWYAEHTGLSLLAIGVGLSLARLLDFFSDAVVGIVVDRSVHSRWRYKPWIVVGTLIACTALFALAMPPSNVSVAYLALWAAVLFTGWTMIMVPYTAWGAELATDGDDRSRLTNSREVAGMLGMLSALALPLLIANGDNVLLIIAFTAAVFAVPAVGFCFLWVPDIPTGVLRGRAGQWRTMLSLTRYSPFARTMTYWLLNGVANGLPGVLFPIVVTGFFGLTDDGLYALLLIYFSAAILCSPLWVMLARRCGKITAWRAALGLSIAAFLPALLLAPHQSNWFALICLLTGATLAADLALPPSIQADVLERDREISRLRRSGAAFALWSMATKLALAIAVAVGFMGLHYFGVEVTDGINATEAVPLMGLYVAIPVTLKTVIILLTRNFEIDLRLEREALAYPATKTAD